jgi:hypothetical protein
MAEVNMVKSRKFLALIVLSGLSQGLSNQCFASNILGQPDFMNPVPPPSQGSIETSWGNNPSGAQSSYGNSGSSRTGTGSLEVGQPYQAPLMSQPSFVNPSSSYNAAPTNYVPSSSSFTPLPPAPNPFDSQHSIPQGNSLQAAAAGMLQAHLLLHQFYAVDQVNKVNSMASIQNWLLDESQFKARQDQLRSSPDIDGLINDFEALASELISKSGKLDSLNHETLQTFNDNQKSPNQQIRALNQVGFDEYYKSYTLAAKFLVETTGWAKTSINQLRDRKKHFGVNEREQRIQDAVDRATADARNRLEQARQATSNRRVEIREIQRIRANVNSSQIQQMHVERIVSEVNEVLPRMTAQMEQAAGDYLREQLESSQQLAQTGVELAFAGASESVVRIVSGFAIDTVTSIQSFTSGLAGGCYQGFLTSAQVATAIFSDPTLISNLSVSIMNTISGGPGAVGNVIHNAFQHAAGAVYQFEITMAYGTASERGHALGEFGANIILGIAGGEAAAGFRATLEGIATSLNRGSASEALGSTLNASLKVSEALASEMATIQTGVNEVFSSVRKWKSVESLLHTAKGNIQKAPDGIFKLKSGMHTQKGFEHFLEMSKKSGNQHSIQVVEHFVAENLTVSILKQKLANGVTRLQLPKEAWINSKSYGRAVGESQDGLIKGAKTLFPESFTLADIAEAAESVLTQNPGSNERALNGVYKGIKVRILRNSATGKIKSVFPRWTQE